MKKRPARFSVTNVAGLFVTALLLSFSFTIATPQGIAKVGENMLASASIGMSAGVEENPFNTLAQQLGEKESELLAKEKALRALEKEIVDGSEWTNTLAFSSLALSITLLALVGANFYFDQRRNKRGLPPLPLPFPLAVVDMRKR